MKTLLFQTLLERLQMPNVIVGLILSAIGLAVIILSRKITRAVRQKKDISTSDNVYLSCKAFGLVAICVALVVMIVA